MMRSIGASLLALLLSSCGGLDINHEYSSDQYDQRIRYIVIHTTQTGFDKSMQVLTDAEYPVSSHYLIPSMDDPDYASSDMQVYQLVPDHYRAWHAGISAWQGRNNINDQSIGIELVYQPHCRSTLSVAETIVWNPSAVDSLINQLQKPICLYPDFDPEQIQELVELIRELQTRYPQITPTHIVAHSDIAPDRKIDPGPRFPWQRLHHEGIGAWYNADSALCFREIFASHSLSAEVIQQALSDYGYPIDITGEYDLQTAQVVTAFQQHFRPWLVDGRVDAESAGILFALLKKYRPSRLGVLGTIAPLCRTSENLPSVPLENIDRLRPKNDTPRRILE
ncbi:N-acetylmuramoyl-L-alanine amidase AmiD [BD1-7 clade bacterium]|uniref:N-acetylmuramoyl-L-alanine amidase n=1 Tax=BD1-7 clade bacterium TaxID=2029982 RepID=A0A5S9QWR0_9GAMM|nr:N-acetylmuramoyl-L-alanine amidase AmiD [BD1-7 clade bacterium]